MILDSELQLLLIDSKNVDNYYPFSILHPIWELRTGALRTFERYQKQFANSDLHFYSSDLILNSFLNRFNLRDKDLKSNDLLVFDSSLILLDKSIELINSKLKNNKPFILIHNDEIIGLFVPGDFSKNHPDYLNKKVLSDLNIELFSDFEILEISDCIKINFLWDTFNNINNLIKLDKDYIIDNDFEGNIHKSGKVHPTAVIDEEDGPVIIDENAKVMPFAYIEGPCYIGKNSLVKVHSKIYENSSIGDWCKVAGEIENSILQSYSNKQHDGFLGHSFISEWVNLGAGTNNSDLKNTYGNISVKLRNEIIDTQRMFMGLLCGDHTKTAINTTLNTGTVTGIFCNIFKAGLTKNSIPSFQWYGDNIERKYVFEKTIQTAEKVMQRRKRNLNKFEIELFKLENELS